MAKGPQQSGPFFCFPLVVNYNASLRLTIRFVNAILLLCLSDDSMIPNKSRRLPWRPSTFYLHRYCHYDTIVSVHNHLQKSVFRTSSSEAGFFPFFYPFQVFFAFPDFIRKSQNWRIDRMKSLELFTVVCYRFL